MTNYERVKRLREKRKAMGICICGKPLDLPNRTRCVECREKNRVRQKNYCVKRLGLNLCLRCGKPRDSDKTRCQNCFIKEQTRNRFYEERNKTYYRLRQTKEQLEKLEQLANKQQDFSNFEISLKESCEVCFSKENLIVHEITYYPLEVITLCASCHAILHSRFLKGKKVKPKLSYQKIISNI